MVLSLYVLQYINYIHGNWTCVSFLNGNHYKFIHIDLSVEDIIIYSLSSFHCLYFTQLFTSVAPCKSIIHTMVLIQWFNFHLQWIFPGTEYYLRLNLWHFLMHNAGSHATLKADDKFVCKFFFVFFFFLRAPLSPVLSATLTGVPHLMSHMPVLSTSAVASHCGILPAFGNWHHKLQAFATLILQCSILHTPWNVP